MATNLQEKAVANIVRNGVNASRAMREAGYSRETSKDPTKLTKSKGFEALMKKYLPDTLLAKVHNEGLKATKYENQLIGRGESEIVEVPDFAVRHRYLDTAYKVKRVYSDAPVSNTAIFVQVSEAIALKNGLTQLPE